MYKDELLEEEATCEEEACKVISLLHIGLAVLVVFLHMISVTSFCIFAVVLTVEEAVEIIKTVFIGEIVL